MGLGRTVSPRREGECSSEGSVSPEILLLDTWLSAYGQPGFHSKLPLWGVLGLGSLGPLDVLQCVPLPCTGCHEVTGGGPVDRRLSHRERGRASSFNRNYIAFNASADDLASSSRWPQVAVTGRRAKHEVGSLELS